MIWFGRSLMISNLMAFGSVVWQPREDDRLVELMPPVGALGPRVLRPWLWTWTTGGWRTCLCLCPWARPSNMTSLPARVYTERILGSRGWFKMALQARTPLLLAGAHWAAVGFALHLRWLFQSLKGGQRQGYWHGMHTCVAGGILLAFSGF